MKAYETTFQKMVEGTKQFQVPLYQRPYSWTKKELGQLWDDLTEQAAAVQEAESQWTTSTGHFMGSVVLAPGLSAASDMTRWLLIDGQQRLTTLTIAFAAIRDRLRVVDKGDPEEPGEAERIHNTYLVNQYKRRLDKYRIVPTQSDRRAFQSIIDGGAQAGSTDNVGFAYNYFTSRIRNYSVEELLALEATIGRGLSLVEIQADPGDNVFRIFESLNNTGKGLSQTDLLRNYVFMLLPHTGEEVYDEVWLPMQEELGPENLETLAWLDLILRGNEDAKQREVYRTQQQRLEKVSRAGGESAVREELKKLRRLGQLLLRIVDPPQEHDESLRLSLSRLAAWGNTVYRPLALRLMVLRDQGHASTEEVARALGHIESYLVRRMLVRMHTQGLNVAFLRAPAKLVPGEAVDEFVHRYLSNPRLRWPSDEALTKALISGNFYWSGRAHQRNYVLRRLEESYNAPEPVDFSKAKLTIEHVMPQRLTPQWSQLLSEQTDPDETVSDLQNRLVHTLGNLTMTAENSKLSNHMFDRKQRIFESSSLQMNREIAEAQSWGRPEIETRSRRLAERSIRLWPSPQTGSTVTEETLLSTEPISQATAMVPAGRWTTCQAIAQVVGTAPIAVSAFLRAHPGAPNSHRVFNSKGEPIAGVRNAASVLSEEGVRFLSDGRPVPSQQLASEELAGLLGMDVDTSQNRSNRFRALLKENRSPAVVQQVSVLLEDWEALGGSFSWGNAQETSCSLTTWGKGTSIEDRWLLVLYPVTGIAEVVFQHLRRRPPFDDIEMRRELLKRLNEVPRIDLPEDALNRRPSFPLDALMGLGGAQVREVLAWFHERCQEWLATQG
ncbi:GmrSD restriction endonuclease domain-containing protein [Nocardiopsis alborubida]|uniref:GmrSD restriction endonuclease domain-containing protein n=1 Tax=Nocardiopsis alborubida TaxID=146802 RepID=UPI00076E49E9|nr:DUF262 domain-containing protein [Nocardiopsis alborubida]